MGAHALAERERQSSRIGSRLGEEEDVLAEYEFLQKKVQVFAYTRIVWIQG